MQHDLLKRTQNVIGTTVQNKKFETMSYVVLPDMGRGLSGKNYLLPIDANWSGRATSSTSPAMASDAWPQWGAV
jgi:hypothetical protein